MTERSEILEMMAALQLSGMRAAYDEIVTMSIKRQQGVERVIHALLKAEINAQKCKGCGVCIKVCPTGAITGEKKKPHSIDPELCIKCGACATACKLHAVEGV